MISNGNLCYLFNSQLSPQTGKFEYGSPLLTYITNQIIALIIVGIFLSMYFITTFNFFISDWKRRNQIYINEYMIKLVEEKINAISDAKKV
ncbi:hypothetical protein COD11_10385 [Bacillus sp. AFS040349]|nr:hypothetical protein COD11_10385 [Bacillus sp. AFS040349]